MINDGRRNRGLDDERRFARFEPPDRLFGGENLVLDFGEFELLGLGTKGVERAFERIGRRVFDQIDLDRVLGAALERETENDREDRRKHVNPEDPRGLAIKLAQP